MNEQWKPVVGWEEHYEVSDHGGVRCLDRYVKRGTDGFLYHCRGQTLKALINKKGYLKVNLSGVGQPRTFAVHTLVLNAFEGPRPDGYVARHLNGNPLDNRRENLCWGTLEENMQDAIRHGTNRNARKTHCKQGHEFAGYNLRIDPATGRRICRTCVRDAQRRRQHRLAGAER